MEEEDELNLLDYRTPKGQLIKLLERKLKKPEIDNSLGEILEKFSDLVNQQTTYLDNGIFHMNFAEDALLLQSCGQLYAKKVDKLWDCLLEFHKRMVTYDETAIKNSADRDKKEARKLELSKLEERLNRGKRKKITLVEPQAQASENDDLAGGQDILDRVDLFEDFEMDQEVSFDFNFEMFDDWRDIQRECALEKKRQSSVLVAQYSKQKYRLRPYSIPLGNDIVYDLNDPEEFNTREGRLIASQHIRHLFEYNDRCLLPDEDFTIAKLRFAYVLKTKWLVQNNIDPNAPYETYKEAYEKYQKDYFECEKRKIQNMPQRNGDDLLKLYKVLERKEEQAREAQKKLRKQGVQNLPEISFENLILEPLKEGYQGDYDPYIPEDMDIAADHEMELSNLFVDSSKTVENDPAVKLRADSGYFDGGFEADDESDREEAPGVEAASGEGSNETSVDPKNVEQATNVNESEGINSLEPEDIQEENTDGNRENSTVEDSSQAEDMEYNETTQNIPFSSSLELQNILRSDSTGERLITEDGVIEKSNDVVMIVYNKENQEKPKTQSDSLIIAVQIEKQKKEKVRKEVILSNSVIKQRLDKKQIKRKIDEETINQDLESPKRRKLSKKQIENLKKGLISPVKNSKFESFHSMNYQPESGEGKIQQVEYESDADSDMLNDEHQGEADHNISGYHSDQESSHLSDHDYCLPPSPGIPEPQDAHTTLLPANESNLVDMPVFDFNNIDLISELSKNTGVSQEELAKQTETRKESMTQYEQEREKTRERVTEWKDHIGPKLKKLNENDFDIHQYGSTIMDSMTEDETKHFGDLVKGKSSAEVVRYFISTLQLANTMNVEICGAKKGELSNDTFHLKLLSKERYHERFREYQAPSEESLKHKLAKVKEIQKESKLHGSKSKSAKSEKHVQIRGTYQKLSENKEKASSAQKKIKILNYSQINPPRSSTVDFQQPSTSRQADEIDQLFGLENFVSPSQSPNYINKRNSTTATTPSKKMKILNQEISSPPADFQWQLSSPQPHSITPITSSRKMKILNQEISSPAASFQRQLSISQHANEAYEQVGTPHNATRFSIDSGYVASYDEEFQQNDSPSCTVTSMRPGKILRIHVAQHSTSRTILPENIEENW